MNTQYNVLLRLYESLRRGDLWDNKIQLVSFSMQAFRAKLFLTYWPVGPRALLFMYQNHMTIC